MTKRLDTSATRIVVRTRAKGLLSAVAHDLEILATDVGGEADDAAGTAHATIGIAGLRVQGAIKKGRVDPGVLSESDRKEIERKIVADVLAGGDAIVVDAKTSGKDATITVKAPRGSVERKVPITIETRGADTIVRGETKVSLHGLGGPTVKGPLGAFSVADDVEVVFEVAFA